MILEQLDKSPETIAFNDVITYIDGNYDFTPTEFKNGNTLNLFGAFYREDVLKNPEGTDHQNIRNFIEFGWDGIAFEGEALKKK